MNIWKLHCNKHLSLIDQTRWWAKYAALKKFFGFFGKPEKSLYCEVLWTLVEIQNLPNIEATPRIQANAFIHNLLKYETILTAQIFLRIFEHTDPLSKYLQTSGLDLLCAHGMVETTQNTLQNISRDFNGIKDAAQTFVQWANKKLRDEENEFVMDVEDTLPQKRVRKKKLLPDEKCDDESLHDPEKNYEVESHNKIMDNVTEILRNRFSSNKTIYADLSVLDPKKFNEINENGLPDIALHMLSKCLIKFDSRATVENLQLELKNLAKHWDKLKRKPLEAYFTKETADTLEGDEELDIVTKKCTFCKNCSLCCYHILQKYNLLTDAYHIIGLAYKFLLTLSVTQVACERSFSTLKYIKNRLRSTLSQEHLSAFMLMSTERDILMGLNSDEVIDNVAENSDLLRKLLTYM